MVNKNDLIVEELGFYEPEESSDDDLIVEELGFYEPSDSSDDNLVVEELGFYEPEKSSNFSLLEKAGLKKPKGVDVDVDDTSSRITKGIARGFTSGIDSLGSFFKSLGDDGEVFGNELLADATSFVGDSIKFVTEPTLEALEVESPGIVDKLSEGLGSTASIFIPGMGATKGAQVLKLAPKLSKLLGMTTAGTLEASMGAGQVYDNLIAKGETESEAGNQALKSFYTSIPTNIILDKWMFTGNGSGKVITQALKGMTQEGAQEGIQQVIQNYYSKDPAFQGVAESVALGGVIGGGVKGAIAKGQKNIQEAQTAMTEQETMTEEQPPIQPQEQETIEEPLNDNEMSIEQEPKPRGKMVQDVLDLAQDTKTQVKAFGKKYFTKEGNMPVEVYHLDEKRKAEIGASQQKIKFLSRDFDKAKEEFGRDLSEQETLVLNDALNGKVDLETTPLVSFKPTIQAMRNEIDVLSQQLIDEGVAQGDLKAKIGAGKGVYVTRAYEVHSDPKWLKKTLKDKKAWNKAIAWYSKEMDVSDETANAQLRNYIEDHQKMFSDFYGSKIGSKSLGILKKRKVVPEEIRKIMGEILDPKLNFENTAMKIANLVANHNFLTDVKKAGEGSFLFSDREKIIDGVSFNQSLGATDEYSPLAGMYTSKEIAEAMKVDPKNTGALMDVVMKAIGLTKVSKTILYPVTHLRNVTSAKFFGVANGHFNIFKIKDAINASRTRLGAGKQGSVDRDYLLRLARLGLLDQSTDVGIVKEIGVDKLIPKRLKKSYEKISELYQTEDFLLKAYGFENERADYRKALPELSDQEIDEICAENVKNTYPTYSRVPKGIKYFGKSPLVGSFVSFPSEVIRTSYGTLNLIKKELKDPKLKPIGQKRLAGFATMVFTTSHLASALGRMLTGVSKDEEDALRSFVPEWSKNSPLFITGFDKDKKEYSYIDLGGQMPHAYLFQPFQAFLRGEDISSSMVNAFAQAIAPFVSEEMLIEKLLDVARNTTKEGRPIYSSEDTGINKTMKSLAHVYPVVEFGFVNSARRLVKKQTGEAGYYGNVNSRRREFLAQGTGVRVSKYNIPKTLTFKGIQFKDKINQSMKVSSYGNIEDKERAYRRSYDWMYKHIQDAMKLGVTDSEIKKSLKGIIANTKNRRIINSLINGNYERWVQEHVKKLKANQN